MLIVKSRKLLFILPILFFTLQVKSEGEGFDTSALTIVKPLLGIGATTFVIKKGSETSFFEYCADAAGVKTEDLRNTLALEGALIVVSLTAEGENALAAKNLACKLPIVGLFTTVYYTETIQEMLRTIPAIGGIMTCPKKCKKVCHACFLTKGIIQIGIWKAVDTLIPKNK
jgi:hypothetical protein